MINPHPKQVQAIQKLSDSTTNFVGYGGAAFSGKSYLACRWLTTMCLRYPDTGWGLGRKELTVLKKTTFLTLMKVFSEMNIKPDRDYKFNGQLNVVTFSNKSQIFLIDMAYKPSDPLFTRFGGYELTGAAVDESAETMEQAINILFTRLGRRNNHKYGLTKKLFETFNPDKGHVYRRYFVPYRDSTMEDNYAFIPALPKDNPAPEVEDYIRDIIRAGDKTTIERLIHGNFEYDNDPSKLIEYDNILNLFTNDFIKPSPKKYITVDVALQGSDKFVLGVWEGWVLTKIYTIAKCNAKEATEFIRAKATLHHVPRSHITYDADGLGSFLRGYLEDARPFVNGRRPLAKENYANLKTQCAYRIAARINRNEVFCKDDQFKTEIIEELEQIKRDKVDKDGKLYLIPKDKVKELIKRSPDFSDMILMREIFDIVDSGPLT